MTIAGDVAAVLRARATGAMFVTEVCHALGPRADPAAIDDALDHLTETGAMIVVTKPAPDVHLHDIDLRIVALATPSAVAAVETVWHEFLREFLASHRCS